jgi:hypothetical protein
VTRLDNGQPLRRVLVTITAADLRSIVLPAALTDDSGRFELAGLPAARYALTASKGGFVTLQYGQSRPNQPGRPIELGNAVTLEGVNLALPRGGAVTGRIVDESGEPVPNATVRVLRQRYVRGLRQFSNSVAEPDSTDDRGEFRVYGVPPGTYYVTATKAEAVPGPGAGLGPAAGAPGFPTFYPGSSSPDGARPVTVALGQEVAGLSFALVPTTLATLTVTVRMPDGQLAPPTTNVTLVQNSAAGGAYIRAPRPTPEGRARSTWTNLPPGEYVVQAQARSATEPSGGVAEARVSLDGVDAKVDLVVRKGDIARGRITFDADTAAAALRPDQVSARPISLDPLETTVQAGVGRTNADWTFEVSVTPGARLLRASLPTGWALKSVRLGDRDVTDTPLIFSGSDIDGIEILVTDKLTEVSGTIRNAGGDASVVLLSDDPARWTVEGRYVAVVRPDQAGRFTHRGLPPARYVAVALDYLEPGEETNPETLRHLQDIGVKFNLAEGESKTLDLTLSNLP